MKRICKTGIAVAIISALMASSNASAAETWNFRSHELLDTEKVVSVSDPADEECELELCVISERIPLSRNLQERMQTFCGDCAVPYEIALAVVYQESRFQSDAENGSCVGLMQINQVNGDRLFSKIGVTDLRDPEQNLHAGIWMLGELFEKYGEWNMALTAYNNGESGAKKKFFDKGMISCPYSESVLRKSDEWRKVLEEIS